MLTRLELARAHLGLADPAGARALLLEIGDILHRRPGLGRLEAEVDGLRTQLAAIRGGVVGVSTLTGAELRLIPMLATHLSFREIGERLFVSPNTVKTQAMSAYRKLEATSRSEAVRNAARVGLLDPARRLCDRDGRHAGVTSHHPLGVMAGRPGRGAIGSSGHDTCPTTGGSVLRAPRPYEEVLRRLTLNDERFVRDVLGRRRMAATEGPMDARLEQLVRVAALIALDAGAAAIDAAVATGLAVGATPEDMVDVLLAVGPSVGSARLVGMAPLLGSALGYDVFAHLERLPDGHGPEIARS